MRVYLPLTLPALAAALEEGAVSVAVGFAVTDELRAALALDDEDLEYEASRSAAAASLLRIRQEGAPLRRVVLAVDIDDRLIRAGPGDDLAMVHLDEAVAWSDVAAGLADEDQVTERTVEDEELGWYATQELPALVQRG